MNKKQAFISFDCDHDTDLKNLLVGQCKRQNPGFKIVDMSIREDIDTNGSKNARRRIKCCDLLIVLCGEYTYRATGVSTELNIAHEEEIPYFLLWGRRDKHCTRPLNALRTDIIYQWTWSNLKALVNGVR